MIELYTAATANGQKVAIMLEECGLPYRTHVVDLVGGEHMSKAFLDLNPGGKIPVIIDPDGPGGAPFTLSQSLAIVVYLAEKTGRFMPEGPRERAEAWRYMALTASDASGAFSGLFVFGVMKPLPDAVDFFRGQAQRQLAILDQRLGESRYLAGDAYSIADILTYPAAATSPKALPGGIADYANLRRWVEEIGARPAVQRGLAAAPGH